MSDVLDRIRRELQQRLESTRAAAQEHERVRAALDALEHAVPPLEKVARRASAGGTDDSRSSAGARRPVDSHNSPTSSRPRKPSARRRTAASSAAKARSAAK